MVLPVGSNFFENLKVHNGIVHPERKPQYYYCRHEECSLKDKPYKSERVQNVNRHLKNVHKVTRENMEKFLGEKFPGDQMTEK